MKGDDLEWEIGNLATSELKTVTVLLQEKKGEKKEYPVLLKAFLVSIDKVLAEAAPVTLIASEPMENASPVPDSITTPTAKETGLAAPAKNPISQEDDVDEDNSESGTSNAQPAPTSGH